jgi:hypothetical protein
MGVLDDLGSYLEDEGVGTLGSTLFLGGIPADPAPSLSPADAVTSLELAPGPASVFSHDGRTYIRPVVQVRCRGTPYGVEAATTQAMAIYRLLDGLTNITVGEGTYLSILAMESPWRMATDDYSRPIMVFRVVCARREA